MASNPSSDSSAIAVASRSLMPESRAMRRAVETFQMVKPIPTNTASTKRAPKAAPGPLLSVPGGNESKESKERTQVPLL